MKTHRAPSAGAAPAAMLAAAEQTGADLGSNAANQSILDADKDGADAILGGGWLSTMLADTFAPALTGKPLLREGSDDAQVYRLQLLLNEHYDCDVELDGTWDKTVTAGVKKAQLMAGVGVDGVVGPQTAAALSSGKKKPRPKPKNELDSWRLSGEAAGQPEKSDIDLDVAFMYQGASYNKDGTAWDGKSERPFVPAGNACVDAAQAMAATTGAMDAKTCKAQQDILLIFSAGDEVANDMSFFGEQGAQLDRSDEARMAEVRERTLEGIAYIDSELEAGRAVVVGVTASTASRNGFIADESSDDYEKARQWEGVLDHGVVITGRQGNRYRFNDPGRSRPEWGEGLYFILDDDGVLKSDPDVLRPNQPYYEVSTVVKNGNGR